MATDLIGDGDGPLRRKIGYMHRWTALCFLCLLFICESGCGQDADVYSISIPPLKISPEESVSSFELSVSSGQVQAVTRVPVAWNVAVENNVDWHCVIRANTSIGAATMMRDEISRMAFSIRKNEYDGRKFNVSGFVMLGQSSGNQRRLSLKMGDFALTGTE